MAASLVLDRVGQLVEREQRERVSEGVSAKAEKGKNLRRRVTSAVRMPLSSSMLMALLC